jgi:hypothetical protein
MSRKWPLIPGGLWLLAQLGAACGPQATSVMVEPPHDAGRADSGPLATVDAGADAGPSTDAGSDAGPFERASHPAFPQIPYRNGPILAQPHIVTITFAGFSYEADVQAFGDWIATSDWLTQVGADYGVSQGQHVKKVVLSDVAPDQLTSDDIGTLLGNRIQDGTLPDPAADRSLLFVIYYPSNSSITLMQQGQAAGTSCQEFGGFHSEAHPANVSFPFAVIPTCSNNQLGLTALQHSEVAASHEIIEAASDPYPDTAPGYQLNDLTSAWAILGGEIGDFCFLDYVPEGNFMAQRIWSNSAAAKGSSPCIPFPSDISYFNAAASPGGFQLVSAGRSTTFDISGWSTGPVSPWALSYAALRGNFNPTVNLSTNQLDNGQSATLTVGVPPGTPSHSFIELLLVSQLPGQGAFWPVAVYVP